MAKEPSRQLDLEFDKQKMLLAREKILLCSSAPLCARTGKFWDSDSDSDCEGLGDADVLAQSHRRSVPSPASRPPAAAHSGKDTAPSPPSQARRKEHGSSLPSPGRV